MKTVSVGAATVVSAILCLTLIIPAVCFSQSASLEKTYWMNQQVLDLMAQGKYQIAIPVAREALKIRKNRLGPDHLKVATSLNNLASLYESMGAYGKAKPLYKNALAITKARLGPGHPKVATSLNNLALLYQSMGAYDKAEPLYRQALAIDKKEPGKNSLSMATHLNNLAGLYEAMGAYGKAEPMFEEALKIHRAELGPGHPKVATSLNNLAGLYESMGAYGKAAPMYKKALNIRKNKLDASHPDVAASLNNLASLYKSMGAYGKAEPMFKEALKIHRIKLGAEHPKVATSLNNLASLYESMGAYAKAEPLYRQALAIDKKKLGKNSLSMATHLNNLAGLYQSMGAYGKAEPMFKEALKIHRIKLGAEHPKVATSLNNLALLYKSMGAYGKAEPMYRQALGIRKKKLGADHPDVATSLNNLASLYHCMGEKSRAEELYMRALLLYRDTLGVEHPAVYSSFNSLSFLYLSDGRVAKAFENFKELNSHAGLAVCCLKKRNYKKALAYFEKAEANRKGVLCQRFKAAYGHPDRYGYGLTEGDLQKYAEFQAILEKPVDLKVRDNIGLALAHEGLKNYDKSRYHFKQAIVRIEAQWAELPLSARKTFLAGGVGAGFTRLDAYEGMVRLIVKQQPEDAAKQALGYAEQVKSRTLLELLAEKGGEGLAESDQGVYRQDQAYQQRIKSLKEQIQAIRKYGPEAGIRRINDLENELAQTLQKYERFITEVKLQNRELASLLTVETASVEEIQDRLNPDTTILEYLVARDQTYAWVITSDDVRMHAFFPGRKVVRQLVNDMLLPNISNHPRRPAPKIILPVGAEAIEPASASQREKNRENFLDISQKLYTLLFTPVCRDIHTRRLVIIPHGVLHKLPFAALANGNQYLIDKYALSVLPSASVLAYLSKKRNENKGRLVGFANPTTPYVPLAHAETEVKHIAGLFARKETYFQANATEARAKSRSAAPDVLHFACHGEFNDHQPMQSALILAPDVLNDGNLQVHELFGLNLKNANLVVLSACNTGLSKISGGDDLIGLARGFIYAGTPSLMATLWSVEDRSTAHLMAAFYKNWHQKHIQKSEALRQAQLDLKSKPEYRHPFYWAPFVMIGDWR